MKKAKLHLRVDPRNRDWFLNLCQVAGSKQADVSNALLTTFRRNFSTKGKMAEFLGTFTEIKDAAKTGKLISKKGKSKVGATA